MKEQLKQRLDRIKAELNNKTKNYTIHQKAAKSLLLAIEGLERECAKWNFPDEDSPIAWSSLHEICDQWEEKQ